MRTTFVTFFVFLGLFYGSSACAQETRDYIITSLYSKQYGEVSFDAHKAFLVGFRVDKKHLQAKYDPVQLLGFYCDSQFYKALNLSEFSDKKDVFGKELITGYFSLYQLSKKFVLKVQGELIELTKWNYKERLSGLQKKVPGLKVNWDMYAFKTTDLMQAVTQANQTVKQFVVKNSR
ncbi:MAG: hypothetical protein MI784_17465 [Cytophagales bacterium]|nr:hypothetical protein [Cytophagales bacterium]